MVNLSDAPAVDEQFAKRARSNDEEITEMVVPVTWEAAVPPEQAVSEPGLFASQVTVCKLRDERTIELVEKRFGLRTNASDVTD